MEMNVLVFDIGELWGMDIRDVREVVKVRAVTRVPGAPHHILGVFNLRGQIVTLISLAKIIGLNSSDTVDKAIIIEKENEVLGIAVRDVVGVIRIESNEILPPPPDAIEFMAGVVRSKDKLIAILNVDKLYEYLLKS